MGKLEIKKFNEPILRQKAQEITEIVPGIKKLAFDMAKLMKEKQGIGLAGPQIGVSKRIIIVQPDLRKLKTIALINPKIIKKSSEREIGKEGCLSFPNIFLRIKRVKEVEVEALNIEGKKVIIKAEGLLSRVFQHEIDHLEGIVFLKRLSPFQRIRFKLKHPKIKI